VPITFNTVDLAIFILEMIAIGAYLPNVQMCQTFGQGVSL